MQMQSKDIYLLPFISNDFKNLNEESDFKYIFFHPLGIKVK